MSLDGRSDRLGIDEVADDGRHAEIDGRLIEDGDLVSVIGEVASDVVAEKSGSAGDQRSHGSSLCSPG